MEFESDKNNPEISEDARRLAQTKKITLLPMHSNITPEEVPEAEIAARYTSGKPVENVPGDVEQKASPIQPSRELLEKMPDQQRSRTTRVFISAIAIAMGATMLIALYFAVG